MGPEAFDRVVTRTAPGELPLRVELTNDTWRRLPGIALLFGLAGLIGAPQAALAIYALNAASPLIGLELGLGFILLIGLVWWPLRLGITRLAQRRTVEISRDHVFVTDRHLLGDISWSAPISEFAGVAHHLRSSLSGIRHELVLVHPERRRSLILRVSEKISERDLDDMRRLLLTPEVAPLALYQPRRTVARPAANRPASAIPSAHAA